MKKLQIILLFVFLVGCAPSPNVFPVVTPSVEQTPILIPTQTAIPPTETLTAPPTFTPLPTATATGGGAGKIAFTSEQDGYPEIYVINSDGTNLIKLSNEIHPKSGPSWSPDGTKIAFATNNNDSASLYIMNADGSNPVKLIDTKDIAVYDQATPDWRFGGSALWSPDGTKLVFRVSYYIGCCFSYSYIHVVNANGSGLISSTIFPIWERLVWSPDSQKIAFGSGCGGWGICVMNADGTDLINLTKSHGGWPSWSPDGKRIAFSSARNGTNDIYVMNVDGTNIVDLTNNNNASDGGPEAGPIWSPDGEKIVFSSSRDDGSAIYVMNADGTNLINLTSNHPISGLNMVLSPDSSKIAFVSDVDGNSEIYVVDVDGSNLIRLTNNDANVYSPVWSP
jgi:Tol biopolymer transport system component